MELSKSTLVFLGSSVTYGVNNRSMCEYIAETTGATVIKWAVSATTLTTARPNSYVKRLLDVIDSQDVCDHFVVQLSTNDAGNYPLGEIGESFTKEDFDTDTTIGAIEFIIATARERWGCPVSFYTGTYMKHPAYEKMVEALFEIAKKWNIGILDLWYDPEMRAVSEEDYAIYMSDPVHPTWTGYEKWWGPKFVAYLEKK